VVPPGYLTMVSLVHDAKSEANLEPSPAPQRLQLAQWIADRANPLTARVMVNRVWQHHFGEGLVRTPDNFGTMGEEPTHPELLDWLTLEFMDGGWKLKRLHKLIMLSAAYQMDSVHPQEAEYSQSDFANRLWWKRNRLRLEAEPLRDAMLASSGEIDLKIGGPSFAPPVSREALEGLSMKAGAWKESPPEEQKRRSVYMMTKRSLLLPLMTTFDFADTTQPVVQRSISTVAPQALALLNNAFVHEQSRAFAARLHRDVGEEREKQIDRAWWLALSRAPTEKELVAAIAHLEAQAGSGDGNSALVSLCHVLLNTNEFIYVD
jgi:hypothetical protein